MLRIALSIIATVLIFQNMWAQSSESNKFFEQTDSFLSKYVEKGRVDYQQIRQESGSLNALVEIIASTDLAELNEPEKKAFLINAYNIATIKAIIDLNIPDSPLKVDGFWDKENVQLRDGKYSLNQIEKELLLPVYNDARLHFALVCAAVGCPKLQSYSYHADQLDEQLEIVTKEALNSDYFTRVNEREKSVALSEIFTWYEADFLSEADSILDYVNNYRKQPIPNSYSVTSYSYDWSLNIQN